MIPQHTLISQRLRRGTLALVAGVAVVPLLTTITTVEAAHGDGHDDAAAAQLSADELAVWVETVLADAISPGSIHWNAPGVDVPPTAAVAAVRIPGRDDVLVAVGENLDGSPAEADAPFFGAILTVSLVQTVAFQLIDDGALDPTLTVDQWVPELPNADRVTVQMVIDDATGWSDWGAIEPDPEVGDMERVWDLREAVELRATVMTALAEPGTRTNDGGTNEMALGLIVQEVGGRPLAELIDGMVSEPAGLDDTLLLDGNTVVPDGYRHGVFAFNGTPVDTSSFDGTAYTTWNLAWSSVVTTPGDVLDLLDAWSTGALFTTGRTPSPDHFAAQPVEHPTLDVHLGVGVPFNGFCPCTDVDGGVQPAAIGRSPYGPGSATVLLHYADGISVVVNVNSNGANPADIQSVVDSIHDIAVAAG